MLYRILKALTKLALLAHYRKIYLNKKQDIPQNRPVILASNHPNAFTEPLLLACFLKTPLYFITRADVFKPSLQWFFDQTHQIPIYRFEDGYAGIKKNINSFDRCYDILAGNKTLLIFSEGRTRLGKKVYQIQKGTARIALGLMDKYPEARPLIIPVGFTYSKPTSWDGVVLINIGDPIEVYDYVRTESNPRRAVLKITKRIESELKTLAIDLDEPDQVIMEEYLADVQRRSMDASPTVLKRDTDIYQAEKKLVRRINRKEIVLQEKTCDNCTLLAHRRFSLLKLSILIVFLIPSLIGLVLFLPAGMIGNYIKKYKVQSLQFKSGVLMSASYFASLLLTVIWTIVALFAFGWLGLVALIFIPILIIMGIKWMSYAIECVQMIRWTFLSKPKKQRLLHKFQQWIPELDA